MGIKTGYTVERADGAKGVVLDTRAVERGQEPCFATVRWPDGEGEERLRDLISAPPPHLRERHGV